MIGWIVLKMALLAMLFSLLIGIIITDGKKPYFLLFEAVWGTLIGLVTAGIYLAITGGLEPDSLWIVLLPSAIGAIAGFFLPLIIRFTTRVLKEVPRAFPKWTLVLPIAMVAIIIVGVSASTYQPATTMVMASPSDVFEPTTLSIEDLNKPVIKASELCDSDEIIAMARVKAIPTGKVDMVMTRSAGFLQENPNVGDTLKFHVTLTNTGSTNWVKPAIKLRFWTDTNGNGVLDENDAMAGLNAYYWATGEESGDTFHPTTLWTIIGTPLMQESTAGGYIATFSVWKDDTGYPFFNGPGGWTAPFDCYSNQIISEETVPKEDILTYTSIGPGGSAEVYGKLSCHEQLYENGTSWNLRCMAYDMAYSTSEPIAVEDMPFTIQLADGPTDITIEMEYIVITAALSIASIVGFVFTRKYW